MGRVRGVLVTKFQQGVTDNQARNSKELNEAAVYLHQFGFKKN